MPRVTPGPRLLDRVRAAIRTRHYSIRTEEAYVGWIRRFVLFHGKRHPDEMGEAEINAFVSALATRGRVASSTQTQALSALLFLYREVLGRPVESLGDVVRAKRPERLPVVLTREEVRAVLARLDGSPRLVATLLYGTGMRLMECLRLRVKDVDFGLNQILVRDGKGMKDRLTMLPAALRQPLQRHLAAVRALPGRTSGRALVRSTCPTPSPGNTPRLRNGGAGNGSSLPASAASTPGPSCPPNRPPNRPLAPARPETKSAATTSVRRSSSAPSSAPCAKPASASTPPAIPCATPSPPTSSRAAPTYAPSRSSSAIATSPPP